MPQAAESAVKFKNLDRKKNKANLIPTVDAESGEEEPRDAASIDVGLQEW